MALDDAGIDMPEPTYRLQIGHPAEVAAAPGTSAGRSAPEEQEVASADTRALNDIELQIARDPRSSGDLLSAEAPRE